MYWPCPEARNTFRARKTLVQIHPCCGVEFSIPSCNSDTVHVLTPTYTVCDQLLWINDNGCSFLLWGCPSTHPLNLFQYLLFKYCIIYSWIFNDIGRNSLLGNRKKIAKFLMSTFTYCSTFLYEALYLSLQRWRNSSGIQRMLRMNVYECTVYNEEN
jgi:hypothetical protein